MIYCVDDKDVVAHLASIGYRLVATNEQQGFRLFERDGRPFTIRMPNVFGHLPEIVVDDAFHAAALSPPTWTVFWCD